MSISNKNNLDSFKYCLRYYDNNQKSAHWQKYNKRWKLYNANNLKNFRNNSLSQGLDDNYSENQIIELFNSLSQNEKKKIFILKNKKNIGNKKNFININKNKIYGTELFPIKWLIILKNFIQNKKNNILEIGAGFGELSEILIKSLDCKYLIIDLPEANVLSCYYLSKSFKNKKIYIINKNNKFYLSKKIFNEYDIFIIPPWCKIDEKIKFDIVINTRSMMEMNSMTILKYFDLIHSHIKIGGIFFNINRYLKKTLNNKIKICNFPYDNCWDVIESKKSWMQDWIHMLITKRTIKNGNIKKELIFLKLYSLKYELIQILHDLKIRLQNFFFK
jgi:putative sugar O-methyltransferase